MSLKAIVDLTDDWERGCCAYCPFSYRQFDDPDDYDYCALHYNGRKCKLKVIDSEGEFEL